MSTISLRQLLPSVLSQWPPSYIMSVRNLDRKKNKVYLNFLRQQYLFYCLVKHNYSRSPSCPDSIGFHFHTFHPAENMNNGGVGEGGEEPAARGEAKGGDDTLEASAQHPHVGAVERPPHVNEGGLGVGSRALLALHG